MKDRSTGERIMSGIGKEMVGISAGMGAARGPGGFGRAMAESSRAVSELQEKNKAYNMEVYRQHANDLKTYQNQQENATKVNTEHAEFAAPIKEALDKHPEWAAARNGGLPIT